MEIFKNKWFTITILIVLLCLSIPILYKFFNFIIFYYPFWVKYHLTGINQNRGNIGIGTYGDMYGGLNAFVSGFAFLGLLGTIGVQLWLYYREQQLKKKEKLDKADNKLVYLDFLVKQSLSEIEAFKAGVNDLMRDNSLEKKKAVFFKDDNTLKHNKINKIVNKIDQESFFTAYFQKYEKQDLDNLFVSFEELLKSWKSFIKKLRGYKVECDSELFKLSGAFNILKEKHEKAFQSFKEPNKNGTSLESNSLKLRILLGINSDNDILGIIGKKDHLFEIYYTIKDEYESQIARDNDETAEEFVEYLESCKESIEKIEDIKVEIVKLCQKQITEIAPSEDSIRKIKIKES